MVISHFRGFMTACVFLWTGAFAAVSLPMSGAVPLPVSGAGPGQGSGLQSAERLTGVYLYQSGQMIDTATAVPVLRYRDGIIFTMGNDTAVEYSYFMAGPDSEWTEWTDRAYKEYTSLDAGKYIFMYRDRV